MFEFHRILLGTLLNSIWQIPLLYVAAALCSKLLRRSSFHLQHRIWVLTLVLSVSLPVLSAVGWFRSTLEHTFLHARPMSKSISTLLLNNVHGPRTFSAQSHSPFGIFNVANILLALWLAWIVFRAIQLGWSCRRVQIIADRAVHPNAMPGLGAIWKNAHLTDRGNGATVLISDQLTAPATLGIRTPIVLLPCSIAEQAHDSDLHALLAHELAHVARHDFLNNLLQELFTIPMSYHPILRRLRSRISDTRELICDQLAAEKTGSTREYAQSLVRIAALLLESSTITTPALGLFEGQNLENRIMSLLDQTPRLTRMWTAVLGLISLCVFAPCCLTAAAFTFQPAAIAMADLQPYSGTWHWMFKGKSFVTMQLVPAGDHFTGYMTNGYFKNDESGNMIDAGSHPGRSPIVRTFFSGKVLHIVVEDDHDKSLSEWTMKLLDSKKAEFNTADPDVPKNLKSWTAERVAE